MKKSFMYLMTMMMVAMLSVGFASCSNDDDEGSGSSSKGLVGDWEIVGGDEWAMRKLGDVYSFYEDGTCEWGTDGPYTHWRQSGSKLYMTRGDGRVEEYLYEFKEGQLHLTFPDGKATEYTILERVLNIDSSYFIGTWKAAGGSAYGTWEFYADGACAFTDKDGRGFGGGSWKYNAKTKMLTTAYDGWEWEIVSATDDKWTAKNGQSWKRVK